MNEYEKLNVLEFRRIQFAYGRRYLQFLKNLKFILQF
jgi:hypothetical protein